MFKNIKLVLQQNPSHPAKHIDIPKKIIKTYYFNMLEQCLEEDKVLKLMKYSDRITNRDLYIDYNIEHENLTKFKLVYYPHSNNLSVPKKFKTNEVLEYSDMLLEQSGNEFIFQHPVRDSWAYRLYINNSLWNFQ